MTRNTATKIAERKPVDDEVVQWIGEVSWKRDDDRFDQLARRIFSFQFDHCQAYARFCRASETFPDSITSWKDIPAVPTGAFKEVAIRCFPEADTKKTFRTSGTSTEQRGELHLDTLELYEASLWATLKRFLFSELGKNDLATLRILAPAPEEQPDSSLSHMFGRLIDRIGDANSAYDIVDGELQYSTLRSALEQATDEDKPVTLCGTAYAFVHFIDANERSGNSPLMLATGSKIMETGGFKGRSREMERSDLYAALEKTLGISPAHVVNQYGMTELGSQFYDSVLRHPHEPRRKLAPPWARVRIVDPETGRDAAPGELGIIVIHDLANTGSVAAIQTADLGRQIEDGFEVVGRIPDAEARGCSIAADTMLLENPTP